MHPTIDWHEVGFLLAALGVVAFYVFIFVKKINKKALGISTVIFTITVYVGGTLSQFTLFGFLFGIATIEYFKGFGRLIFRLAKPAFSGFIEEFFRSTLVVFYAKIRKKYTKKNNRTYNVHGDVLDNQIYGLAFLFGVIESVRIVYQFFPTINTLFNDKNINLDVLSTSKLFSIHPVHILILAAGLILRYYIHFYLLQLSVYAKASRRIKLFVAVLFLHAFTNIAIILGSFESLSLHLVTLLLIEIIVVIALSLLIKKLKLREQGIAHSPN